MAIKQDSSTQITLPDIESFKTPSTIRSFLLNQWMVEQPKTKYRYIVETLANGSRIYLERPGQLNKGCDFVVFIENLLQFKNGNDKPPKHDYLLGDLRAKKTFLTQQQWQSVLNAVKVIYDVETFNNANQHLNGIAASGLPFETVLKLVRWFFIEQDLTYWAKSGRDMLFYTIQNL